MTPTLRRWLSLPSAAALIALVAAGVRCSPCPTTADLARSEADYAAAVVVACPVATYPVLSRETEAALRRGRSAP